MIIDRLNVEPTPPTIEAKDQNAALLPRTTKAKGKRGMGRIFQRGRILWVAYPHRGREIRESSGSEKEADAVKLLKRRLGEVGRRKLIGPVEERVTFDELSQDLELDYETNKKRSVRSVKLSIHHLKEFFEWDRAVDITTSKIRLYIRERQDEGASNASINRELAAISKMFSLALEAEKLSSSPYIPRLEENNIRQGFLDHGGFLDLREHLPAHLKDPVTFLYLSAWRKGEMKAVEVKDYDRPGRVLRLRPEISKNKKGRLLSLSGELLEIVERAFEHRRLGCRFLFHKNGQPIGDFRKAWWKACAAAGVGRMEKIPGNEKKKRYVGLVVHDLRRTGIRNMVRAGIQEKTAMERSGHKTRNVFDRYNIVSEKDQAEATEKLEAYLKQQPESPKVSSLER